MFSKALSVVVLVALAFEAHAAPKGFGGGRFGGNKGGNNGASKGGNNASQGGGNNSGAAAAAAASQSAAAAAAANTATAAASSGTAAAASSASNSDPQKSLTLDPKVIATGFENNGQDVPEAGQVPSLTSSNNFINFCIDGANAQLPITNGKQITTGSCNPAPIGAIPAVANMPSSKFSFPANMGTVQANTAFTIKMNIKNMITGNFVNAQENYFAAPQQLQNGQIVGHSHVVIEQIESLSSTTPTDPNKFAFFKGLNAAAEGGVLTADVTSNTTIGVPAGAYRLCSINAAANHQPVIVPIAQHGSLDDCIYFTATDNGQAASGSGAAAGSGSGAAAGSAAASTTAAAAAATSAAATGNKGGNNGAAASTGNKGGNKGGFKGGFGRKGGRRSVLFNREAEI